MRCDRSSMQFTFGFSSFVLVFLSFWCRATDCSFTQELLSHLPFTTFLIFLILLPGLSHSLAAFLREANTKPPPTCGPALFTVWRLFGQNSVIRRANELKYLQSFPSRGPTITPTSRRCPCCSNFMSFVHCSGRLLLVYLFK